MADELSDLIDRFGPVPFDQVMELALYDPDRGFFTTTGAAGRRGDFLTSAEVGPLFGAVIARALDTWWRELGSPDPFVVVDAGAGTGALARAVLAAKPQCVGALTYLLVERSAARRGQQARGLPIVPAAFAFPPTAVDGDGFAVTVDAGTGPRAVSMAELPAAPFAGVVIANELLDNLPFRIVERARDGWKEVRVGHGAAGFTEILTECPPELTAVADAVAPQVIPGSRLPLQLAAADWLAAALERLTAGRLVIVDYAATSPELAARGRGWLRTYRAHERGTDPLLDLGEQDITADLAVDQLARVRPPTSRTTQAELLRTFGIDELVAEGRTTWHERAAIGDLGAIRGRSRVREAEALLDPAGLGSFAVLQWVMR
ncbi:MAG: SAM-dependent methyltransferase [Actinobacteria bacterium]|nr:SAM-dependent methyltransferase [Actinomycetota bacterium]